MHEQTETALRVAVNQDLLDEIEEQEEPVDEPDNDEFRIDLSEEEEEEAEEALSEEVPENENQRLSTTENSVGSATRSRQSRSSQITDIYSRPYRTTGSRRSDYHEEENDMIIASEDDLDLMNDEDDFELNEEEEEEEVLEEEEEEEEDDEILENFDDSDEVPVVNTRQTKPKKEKPAPKKISTEPELPVMVEMQSIKRKRRVFTQEILDSSGVPVDRVCAICHQNDDSLGGFLTPVPFVVKDQRVFIHVTCALSSLEVARSASHFYNIFKAVNKAKKIRCCACNHYGATLVCCVSGCLK